MPKGKICKTSQIPKTSAMHNSDGLALSQEGLLNQRADVTLVSVCKIWDYKSPKLI